MLNLISWIVVFLMLAFVVGMMWWIVAKSSLRSRRHALLLKRYGFSFYRDLSDWKFGACLSSVFVFGALLLAIGELSCPTLIQIGGILVAISSMGNLLWLLVGDVVQPENEKVPTGDFTGHVLWDAPEGCRFVDQATPDELAELVSRGFTLYISGHEIVRDKEVGEVRSYGKVMLDFTVVGTADNKDFPASSNVLVAWVCQLFSDAIANAAGPGGTFRPGELDELLRATATIAHQASECPRGVRFAVTVSIPQPDREICRDRVPV